MLPVPAVFFKYFSSAPFITLSTNYIKWFLITGEFSELRSDLPSGIRCGNPGLSSVEPLVNYYFLFHVNVESSRTLCVFAVEVRIFKSKVFVERLKS